jgi:hypothetical protein
MKLRLNHFPFTRRGLTGLALVLCSTFVAEMIGLPWVCWVLFVCGASIFLVDGYEHRKTKDAKFLAKYREPK